ncbi:hypothetical protein E4582_05730 [Luteimonas yindakuii]|uniref:EF-hand domain-containing protein n=1 Tax=Luteimonas yindakuii TaxID=2565782 RepID=A0A4Z1RDS8_9GAMM|nr:hypothetical protein [Luteimonas yindakuii]TKS54313.1 hypothetical protein E4582_05730 [Luteimonas yindakuii]
MKIHMLAAATLAMFAAAGVQAAPPTDQAPRAARTLQLDTNNDGAIDRTEAAASPRLAFGFDRLDSNRDGRLQRDELRGARKGHGTRGRGAHGHGGIDALARLDTDGDGRLSRGELEAAKAAREARAGANPQRPARDAHAARPDLLAQFDSIDRNRDSLLSRGELRSWFEAQRPQREAEMQRRFDERFTAADLNGDGRLSRIEVDEKMQRLSTRFAWLDENGDGFLDRNELRPQRGR